jgi:hypothetical protein
MLCLLLVGRKEEKKKRKREKRNVGDFFSQGCSQTLLAGCAALDFWGC